MLKAKAAKEAAEAAAAEAAGRQRAKDANAATARANDALQEFKRREAEREREADAAIEAYARRKEELAAERTARAAAHAAAKDEQRQAMVRDFATWRARDRLECAPSWGGLSAQPADAAAQKRPLPGRLCGATQNLGQSAQSARTLGVFSVRAARLEDQYGSALCR